MKIWTLLTNVETDIEERREQGKENPMYQEIQKNVQTILVEHMNIEIDNGEEVHFIYEGKELEKPDAFWPMLTNTDAFALEKMLLRCGVKSLVNLDEVAVARSKSLTAQRLAGAGIPTPETIVFFEHPDKDRIANKFGYPFIMKPDNGFGGAGVELIRSEEEYDCYVKNLQPGIIYNAQEFVSTSHGRDVRVVMVKGKYYFSYMRKAADPKEFRSNIHAGGTREQYQIDEATIEMCEKAAALFDLPLLGIDLMFGENGFIVTEVNAFPGLDAARMTEVAIKLFGELL